MSTFSQFQNEFLVAAFDLSERMGEEMVKTDDIFEKYPITTRPNWIMRALFDFRDRGLINNTLTHDGELEQSVWLTASGMREAERLNESGVVIFNADGFASDVTETQIVDSTAWTGLPPNFVFPESKQVEVIRLLDLAESNLSYSDLSQHKQAQARAYIISIRALLEAPDPELDLAWAIIGRANQLAGIASLFVSIIALFQAA